MKSAQRGRGRSSVQVAWPDSESSDSERDHAMTNTEIVLCRADRADREPPDRPPLLDAALADEPLARAQSERVELLGPDGLLRQVTKAVLERALGEVEGAA